MLDSLEKKIFFHPRVKLQSLPEADQNEMIRKFPDFIPFPGKDYFSTMLVIDWDHKLPSRRLFGRFLGFYDAQSELHALREYKIRQKEIKARDKYPEFNVHDFEDLFGDENYLLHLSTSGDVRKVEFISPWRRNISEQHKRKCVGIVSHSKEFLELNAVYKYKCGPLRVLSWVPPCQSHQTSWTVDVRYLTYCESNSIWGKVFLVDVEKEKILNISDFNMRI
ncbi:MAG: hypothetical protein JXR95_15275 [Deltaproteobacteria bacterium]|nr:hypothetical protein [Deltaproteobacteria bacterium]